MQTKHLDVQVCADAYLCVMVTTRQPVAPAPLRRRHERASLRLANIRGHRRKRRNKGVSARTIAELQRVRPWLIVRDHGSLVRVP